VGGRLTPADGVAGGEQFVAGSERTHDERVQVETLAEHPHEGQGQGRGGGAWCRVNIHMKVKVKDVVEARSVE